MTDPRFYRAQGPFSLAELAARAGAEISDQADATRQIRDVAPLETAGPDDLSFLDNKRYLEALERTKAGAVILRVAHQDRLPSGSAALFSADPYRSYALVAQAFYPFRAAPNPGISASARIAESARLGPGCQIDPGAVIMAGAEIGTRTRIGANAVVGENVVIGEDCSIGPGVHLGYCVLGNRIILHPGVCIGQDGFGFARGPQGHAKVPQVGRVIVHDDVEIGANTTIDRGAGPDTIIGPGCMIDNLVQIGHNVQLGRGCVVVAQVGISGSTRLEDYVVLAGQVGVAGHLTLGKGAVVAAKSGVAGNLEPGQTYAGIPAVPGLEWHRRTAILARLAKRHRSNEA